LKPDRVDRISPDGAIQASAVRRPVDPTAKVIKTCQPNTPLNRSRFPSYPMA
jgi:hypothetical protein